MTTRQTNALMSSDELVDIAGRVFVELLILTKNDDCYIDLAKHGQFMRFLEQTALALNEGAAKSISRVRRRNLN